jgi:hypothetical protein
VLIMSARSAKGLGIAALVFLASVGAYATSHVRIVRLSYIDGKVQMDRANGQGLERAMLNTPVVEGSRIITGNDGLAEVEFEDYATVRLGEDTEVTFRQLLVNDAGDKVNEVELVRGTMYFDTRSGKHDIDRVIAADHTFVLRHDSQLRFVMNGDAVQVAALSGEAQLENNGQFTTVKKNETLNLDATNNAATVIAKGVDSNRLDRWNSERGAYQTAYSYNNTGLGSHSLSGYGFQDLAYYGNFMNVSGLGTVWQPYGASSWLGWDPYMAGGWAFTPGFGYMWASAYPWGWLPYHWGTWIYQPAMGWLWSPGSSFNHGGVVNNWQAVAPVVNGPQGYAPPTPPVVSASAPHPSILVGRIGNVPSYLPDGPVPPNFRSVITDHSGLAGTKSSSMFGSTGAGGNAASRNSKALAASRPSAPQSGHVFVAPPTSGVVPSLMGGSYIPPASSGSGGTGMHSSSSSVHTGGSMNNSGRASSGTGHSSGGSPK